MTSLPGARHPRYQHGHTVDGRVTPEYNSWQQMRRRCLDPTHPRFADYGGAGVEICARWRDDFAAFLADMGRRSPGLTLDRIDTRGHYEPGNCRWASYIEQNRNRRDNRRLTFNGETLAMVEWAERTGLSHKTIRSRLQRGWSVEATLTLPRKQLAPGRHAHTPQEPA